MYVNAKLLIGALLLVSQFSLADSPNGRSDPAGDVDHNPKGIDCTDLQTDIISTNLSRSGFQPYMPNMETTREVAVGVGEDDSPNWGKEAHILNTYNKEE